MFCKKPVEEGHVREKKIQLGFVSKEKNPSIKSPVKKAEEGGRSVRRKKSG